MDQGAEIPIDLGRIRWIGFKTIVIREYGRIIRIWGQTLVPPAVTAMLYFVIFGSLIGRRVGEMGGFSYMLYLAPGLIMMSVITSSYANAVSSFFGAKFGKHVEEMLVAPLPNWIIVLGYVAGGILRGLMVGVVVTTVALVFTNLRVHHLFIILAAVSPDLDGVLARRPPERGVRQELRSGQLDPGLRADTAHLFRRRVLFGIAPARVGAAPLLQQSDPAHGQCLPLRVPRRLRRQHMARVRADGGRGGGPVRHSCF